MKQPQIMEITSKLSAPSSRTSTTTIVLKLIVIGILLYMIMILNHPDPALNLQCALHVYAVEDEQSNNEVGECGVLKESIMPLLLDVDSIGVTGVHFINEILSRLVASALIVYVGICCGYVGLVHTKLISPD